MSKSDYAVWVDHISKIYRIGVKAQLADNFAMSVFNALKSPLTNLRKYRALYRFDDVLKHAGPDPGRMDVIWALNDVCFHVEKGEVVGIIGRNGAGKSTLLKIISRISYPTSGKAIIRGRISSLLEVGTGFHPELTGRENVYLNGTILGMRKREIDRKFDDIVAFSGIERFIDTPVKRYSSGMRVRLAFSVAAHLEPDILIIDEVLAVGDMDFQKKCLNKMEDVGRAGRTVLFVSHNMNAVSRLCQRTILLDNGTVVEDGPSNQVVTRYLKSDLGTSAAREWNEPDAAPGNSLVRLRAIRAKGENGAVSDAFDITRPIVIEIEYDVFNADHLFLPHFSLNNIDNTCAFISVDLDPQWRQKPRPAGRYISRATIPGNLLNEGLFFINGFMLTLNPDRLQFMERNAVSFNVIDSSSRETARGDYAKSMGGVLRPKLSWHTEYRPAVQDSAA